MLQAVGVLVPVVVAIVSTFRWPTLERRIRRHVSLVKELPTEVGQPMRRLLEDELAELARRDTVRLAAQEDQIVFAVRLTLFIPLAGVLIASWLTGDHTNGPEFHWGPLLKTYGALLLAWLSLVGMWALTRPVATGLRRFYMKHTRPNSESPQSARPPQRRRRDTREARDRRIIVRPPEAPSQQ